MLVTDVVMRSGINGIPLGRMARLRRRGIRLVCLTGYDTPGTKHEAGGPLPGKPVEPEQLARTFAAELRAADANGGQ